MFSVRAALHYCSAGRQFIVQSNSTEDGAWAGDEATTRRPVAIQDETRA